MKTVSNVQELIRIIGAITDNSKNMPVEVRIWNNKIVRGSNYKGSKRTDVISVATPNIDNNLLQGHVRSLLRSGGSFTVKIGSGCNACSFEWTISDN